MPTSHDQAGAAADAAPDPILTTDTQGTVLYANPSARRLFDDDRVKGKSIFELVTVDDPDAVVQRLTLGPQRVLASVGDDLLDGLGFEVELSIAPTVFDDAERWVVVLHPLPRHGLSVRELLRRATHDDLTALSNRSSLLEHMDATFHDARTASAPHALFMLDLDRFKHINDSWGHDAGDAVLTEVAGRLLEIFRPGDVVARLGGDEFAAWCHDLDEADAAGLADRLATVFERPVLVGDLEIQISGSIGATTSKFAGSARELLRQADAAMYRAKASSSRGHVIFDEEMHEELQERRTREQELRVAITSRQFVLHYQPVVDLLTHRVVGVEALARWDHPRLGRLAPGEFLPLVKSALLGDEFDSQMIELACTQLADWRADNRRPISMWINVSPNHLKASFVDELSRHIADFDLDADQLVIELTEEATVATAERIEVIDAVHALGVRIAVDDFGTGFSQLSYLPDLPLALVKLDKSFVQGIAGQPGRLSLASSVIGLAHALNAEVVAEGVENTADLDAVRYLGCDLAQGFLLARPGPPERVPGLEPGRPRVLRRNWRDGRPDAPETTDDLGQPIIDLRGIDEQPRWP